MAKKRKMYRNTASGMLVSADVAMGADDPSAYVEETVPATYQVNLVGMPEELEGGRIRMVVELQSTIEEILPVRGRLRLQVRP